MTTRRTITPELSVPSAANISSEDVRSSDVSIDASQNIFPEIQRSFCRICNQDASNETLSIFCNCDSPDGFTHVSCLEKQLFDDDLDIDSCDVCNYTYEVERLNRPLSQWTKNKDERHNLILLIIITFGFNTVMLPIMFTIFNTIFTLLPLNAYTIISDLTISTIILVGYCYGHYNLNRHIAKSWRNLRASNQEVRLVVPPRHLYEEYGDNNEESVEEIVV